MHVLLVLLFIGLPIVEIAVLIEAGGLIGLWPTLAIILLTAIAGSILLRAQGFGVIQRIRRQMERGEPPVLELFEGLCVFAAGLLLLLPGFVTDTLGLLLFVPPLRRAIAAAIARRISMRVRTAHGSGGFGAGSSDGARGRGPIIDGDYETVDEDKERLDRRR